MVAYEQFELGAKNEPGNDQLKNINVNNLKNIYIYDVKLRYVGKYY
jgi:hypothetical protein